MSSLVECPHCSTRVLPLAGRTCPACRADLDAPPAPEPVEPAPTIAEAGDRAMPVELQDQWGIPRATNPRGPFRLPVDPHAGTRNMVAGALWCLGGLGVTALTFQANLGDGGGRFVVAWGAVLFGGIQFLRGLRQSLARTG